MRHKNESMIYNIIFAIWFSLLVLDTRAWSFSNLLMAGSQATLSYADTVAIGAQKGLDECGKQFEFERWSCPQTLFANLFQNQLPANREIAFVQAIISAGIVHTVTRNCSLGQFDKCRCDSSKRDKREDAARNHFRWGGCSDDTILGVKIAISFLDQREMGHDSKAIINLHNNKVGRNAVKASMIRTCKCHGISGSCSLQTCWMRINEFHEVGNYLKESYRKAVKIDNNHNKPVKGNAIERKSILTLPTRKLVYSQESPDYCISNATLGSNGTLGRFCSQRRGKNVTKEERRSCRRLCTQCGFKVKKVRRRIIKSCNCKFKFCCHVECQSCAQEQFTFVCSDT